MAKRVESFDSPDVRRYPWPDWTDGNIWEIKQGEDYDVPTENMRVNLHERAKQQKLVVKTAKVAVDGVQGLRFQFTPRPVATVSFPRGKMASGAQRHPRDPARGFR